MNELPVQQPPAVVAARWIGAILWGMVSAVIGLALLATAVLAGGRAVQGMLAYLGPGDSGRRTAVFVAAGLTVPAAAGVAFWHRLGAMTAAGRRGAVAFSLLFSAAVIVNVVFGAAAPTLLWLLVPLLVSGLLACNGESRKAYRALGAGYRPRVSSSGAATGARPDEAPSLYRVEGLVKNFPRGSRVVQAVSDVSFSIARGETLGIVGESGCGKTTLGRVLVRLTEPTAGSLYFEGHDLSTIWDAEMKRYRMQMQIIFQDPYASLNPRLPVGDIIGEGLYNFGVRRSADRERLVGEALEHVGLRKYYINRYPHEFSGGQRQRIGIARALVLRPSFIVADEPVSALDVSIQSQVLNLLKDLQGEFNLTMLFISHNLQVVEHVSDRVGVMYLGKLMEIAPAAELYRHPRHPYTQALLGAVPVADPSKRGERVLLSGDVPSPIDPPSGCRFRTRCPLAQEICSRTEPRLEPQNGDERHLAACHFAGSSQAGETAAAAAV